MIILPKVLIFPDENLPRWNTEPCQHEVMTDRAVLLTPVDIDNLFLIFIFIYPSLFYQSMTKSFPFVRIVFIEYLNILYCTELFHFRTFIDRGDTENRIS